MEAWGLRMLLLSKTHPPVGWAGGWGWGIHSVLAHHRNEVWCCLRSCNEQKVWQMHHRELRASVSIAAMHSFPQPAQESVPDACMSVCPQWIRSPVMQQAYGASDDGGAGSRTLVHACAQALMNAKMDEIMMMMLAFMGSPK